MDRISDSGSDDRRSIRLGGTTILTAMDVINAESMLAVIHEAGLIPFFSNLIPGYSIEERTPREFWFDGGDTLGPWDWKIDCVQSGDIAYGKFVLGGKAAFATFEVYRELLNWRRSKSAYLPNEDEKKVLDLMASQGSVEMREIRRLLGVKKSAADALMARLQMKTLALTGDITRVYRGQDLHYVGWQVSTFCSPESLFEDTPDKSFPFAAFMEARSLRSSLSPAESYRYLSDIIRKNAPDASDAQIAKMLG